jgi:hypothetical protein
MTATATAAIVALLLAGCAQPPKPLYMWEAFPRQQYEALASEGGDAGERIRVMEAHAEKARGANAALPPGFRAHLGMLHLATGNTAAARQMWEAEKSAFPESGAYINRLLERLDGAPKATSKENPS